MYKEIIEQQLKSMDGATFQTLMNSFLSYIGYNYISSPGSVVGKNKTSQGTPDSFFYDNDKEKYIFAEFTTQDKLDNKTKFIEKLNNDIEHCFNTKETRINGNKIQINNNDISEIILAFTSKIKPEEDKLLKSKVKEFNKDAKLTIYSIQKLAEELRYCPAISDFIDNINFNGLTTIDSFLEKSKNGMRPDLKNPFIPNEDFNKYILESISKNFIVALYGNQGMGKSRLTMEIAKEFSNMHDYRAIVVNDYNTELKDSFSKLILKDKKYIIIFDNYDGTFNKFDSIVRYLENTPNDIKIIISLKNQFKDKLYSDLINYPSRELIEIEKMEYEDINKMINKLEEINNYRFNSWVKEKIIRLSNGNPAIALMAALPIINDNDGSYLENPIMTYKNYFENYKKNNLFLNNDDNLKTLGIISFFEKLDKNNEKYNEILHILKEKFDFNLSWDIINDLNKEELVEIYKNEVVKISDDILSTYIFYKVFLDDYPLFDFEKWIEEFILEYAKEINSKIIDIQDISNIKSFKNNMKKFLEPLKSKFKKNNELLLKFFNIFYFIYPIETLDFIKKNIKESNENKLNISSLEIPKNNKYSNWYINSNKNTYITLLSKLYRFDENISEDALNIAFDIILNPFSEDIPLIVIKKIFDRFAIKQNDQNLDFKYQNIIIDFLISKKDDNDEKKLADKIFISYIYHFFEHDGYEEIGPVSHLMTVQIYSFKLFGNESLKSLRRKIINKLIELNDVYPEDVESIFKKYMFQIHDDKLIEVISEEKDLICKLFEKWDFNQYIYSKYCYDYIEMLKNNNIQEKSNFNSFLNKKLIKQSLIYSNDLHDIVEEREEWRLKNKDKSSTNGYDFLKYLDSKIKEEIKDDLKTQLNKEYIIEILDVMNEITLSDRNNPPMIYLSQFFEVLSEKNINCFCFAFDYYQEKYYTLNLSGDFLINIMDKNLINIEKLYSLLNKGEYTQKEYLNRIFFKNLEKSKINKDLLLKFINFLKNEPNLNLLPILELNYYFELYNSCFLEYKDEIPLATGMKNILQFMVKILIDREQNEENLSFDWSDFISTNYSHFENNLNILKDLVGIIIKDIRNNHFNKKDLEILCEMDENFPLEFIKKYHKSFNTEYKSILSFIFTNPNYPDNDIVEEIIKSLIKYSPKYDSGFNTLNLLFEGNIEYESKYISKFIESYYQSEQSERHMESIFNMILNTYEDECFIKFLRKFLLKNDNFEAFKNIPVSTNPEYWFGSYIPIVQSKIEFYKNIIKMIKNLPHPSKFIDHINRINKCIESKEDDLKKLEKNEFKGRYLP
ncbi:MAG: hypothetical protein LBM96_08715 [Methanobrevibacter sp.]|jgi:hypothetical protein|nr:hypothetical protein [Candidatus Methanoflexus mossambicus]